MFEATDGERILVWGLGRRHDAHVFICGFRLFDKIGCKKGGAQWDVLRDGVEYGSKLGKGQCLDVVRKVSIRYFLCQDLSYRCGIWRGS